MMALPSNGHDEKQSTTIELELKRDLHAPAIARAAVIEHCDDFELTPSLCHTFVLLVSELVSNAVLHSRCPANAPVLLTAAITENAIHVTVTDAGPGFTPRPRKPEMVQGGYGLYLVDKEARRWGVDRTTDGTRVWFELSRTA